MIALLLEPFTYGYMRNALWVSMLVGSVCAFLSCFLMLKGWSLIGDALSHSIVPATPGTIVCAFLSCFLMLKGWSLIGDALSHSIVPGVAGAYMLGLPFSLGAFLAGGLASAALLFLQRRTRLKEDVLIGMIFTSFFGLGLFMVSLAPAAVNIQTIVLGNILAITPGDTLQLAIIGLVSLGVLLAKWRDLMLTFFDENQARAVGIRPTRLKLLFFALLSACTVAALQTVGAFLIICMVITPGATAYLITDRFERLLTVAVAIGASSCLVGTYLSYFLDGATGGVIVVLQTLIFLLVFVFARKHGLLAARRRRRLALEGQA